MIFQLLPKNCSNNLVKHIAFWKNILYFQNFTYCFRPKDILELKKIVLHFFDFYLDHLSIQKKFFLNPINCN